VPVPVPVSVSDSVVSSASLKDKRHVTSGEPLLSVVVLLPGCNWLTDAVVEEAEVTNSFGLWFEAMFVPTCLSRFLGKKGPMSIPSLRCRHERLQSAVKRRIFHLFTTL
jgi:hypothetical protein